MSFECIWRNIISHEGEDFETVAQHKPFTYSVINNTLITTRTNYPLSKGNFRKAYELMPTINRAGDFSNIIRGSSYVFAILSDTRIKDNYKC